MNRLIKFTFLVGVLFGSNYFIFSQNNNEFYVKFIETVDLQMHLSQLASDEFDGRMTGTVGQKKAASYIESQFREMNCKSLNGEFQQPFKLFKDVRSGSILFNDQELKFPTDFGFFNLSQTLSFELNDFVFIDEIDRKQDYYDSYIVVEAKDLLSIGLEFQDIACKGFVFILSDYDERYFSYSDDVLTPESSYINFPFFFINQKSLSSAFIKNLKKKKKPSIHIKGILNPNPSFVLTENVIGFVEGSDSILKNEVVVISAHYDHLGSKEDEIYYGADDNGSGTAALIELAAAFQQAKNDGKQPKRSILFIAFTGEELGLLGSTYYTDNPLIPLANTVANLNIDMIGRKTESYETDSLLMVYTIGADRLSIQLDSLIKSNNSLYTNMILDEKYNDVNHPENLYYRSDHYNFAKNGIPSCFFFGGFHEDYHQPTDTIEKISFEKIAQISRLVFHTAWKIADYPTRLPLIK